MKIPHHVIGTPSTSSFLLHGAYKAIGFVVVWMVVDSIWLHGHQTVSWAITVGCITAMFDLAWLYRRAMWRRAVAPAHVFGSAGLGVAIVIAANLHTPFDGGGNVLLRIAAGVMLLAAPMYLMAESARELWLRRSGAGPAPN